MESRKLADLTAFNSLGMSEFELRSFDEDKNSLLVRAHQGGPDHFRVELVFFWVGYLACPVNFFDVRLRYATAQEKAQIGPYLNASVLYCFEDTLAPSGEKPVTFFISANMLEMTVFSEGTLLEVEEQVGSSQQ
jgi:hypothetical protein